MKQFDIFGEEKPIEEEKKGGTTIKQYFRLHNGHDYSHICRDCSFCTQVKKGGRKYYKCEKMGLTSSEATDIRLRDYACLLFKQK